MAVLLTDEQVTATREKIRAVAERQIARDGPAGVSLRAVAAESGLAAASLYRYYASKADLLAATRAAAHDRFSDRIEAAWAGPGDLWDRSRAIGEAFADFAFAEPAAYQLIFAFEQDDTDKTDELRRAETRSHRTLTGYVEDMVAAGLLEGDAEIIAHAYWAMLHGLVVLTMAGKIPDRARFEQLRHGAARLITRGALPARQ